MSLTCEVQADFYTYSEPIARKQHRCVECSAPILKGEKHFAYRGKWEGYIETGRQHTLCMEACMLIRDAIQNECIPFGALKEWVSEYKAEFVMSARRGDKNFRKLFSMMVKIRKRERERVT